MRRAGGGANEDEAGNGAPMASLRPDELDELQRHVPKPPGPAPLPGISNRAKRVKGQLEEDPNNLELLCELGDAYAEEARWAQCSNVLQRAWARRGELEERPRCLYLRQLSEAALQCKNGTLALAALRECPEPSEAAERRQFGHLACRVYSENRDFQRCLKAFYTAIEAVGCDSAILALAELQLHLKALDAYGPAHAAVARLASTAEQRAKLQALEGITRDEEECRERDVEREEKKRSRLSRWLSRLTPCHLCLIGVAAALLLLLYLSVLERRNLVRLHVIDEHDHGHHGMHTVPALHEVVPESWHEEE